MFAQWFAGEASAKASDGFGGAGMASE